MTGDTYGKRSNPLIKERPLKDLFTICAANKPINNAPAVPKKV